MSTIGAKIDSLQKLREKKRIAEKTVTDIAKQMSDLENELMTQMDEEGVVGSKGKLASASISETVKPSIEDWDKFYAYIHRMKYYHLLERRPSVTGCRELFETKGKIPGVVPFTQRKINLRSV